MSSRKVRIENILETALSPQQCDVQDESSSHNVPKGAESHFKIICVTEYFSGMPQVARHRSVNTLLKEEFAQGLHALSLHLFTPEEWSLRKTLQNSPHCLGGQQREQRQKSQ